MTQTIDCIGIVLTVTELVNNYKPLVLRIFSDLNVPRTAVLSREDYISEGMIGLYLAARSFDVSRGVDFSVFASPRIRGMMINFAIKHRHIKAKEFPMNAWEIEAPEYARNLGNDW